MTRYFYTFLIILFLGILIKPSFEQSMMFKKHLPAPPDQNDVPNNDSSDPNTPDNNAPDPNGNNADPDANFNFAGTCKDQSQECCQVVGQYLDTANFGLQGYTVNLLITQPTNKNITTSVQTIGDGKWGYQFNCIMDENPTLTYKFQKSDYFKDQGMDDTVIIKKYFTITHLKSTLTRTTSQVCFKGTIKNSFGQLLKNGQQQLKIDSFKYITSSIFSDDEGKIKAYAGKQTFTQATKDGEYQQCLTLANGIMYKISSIYKDTQEDYQQYDGPIETIEAKSKKIVKQLDPVELQKELTDFRIEGKVFGEIKHQVDVKMRLKYGKQRVEEYTTKTNEVGHYKIQGELEKDFAYNYSVQYSKEGLIQQTVDHQFEKNNYVSNIGTIELEEEEFYKSALFIVIASILGFLISLCCCYAFLKYFQQKKTDKIEVKEFLPTHVQPTSGFHTRESVQQQPNTYIVSNPPTVNAPPPVQISDSQYIQRSPVQDTRFAVYQSSPTLQEQPNFKNYNYNISSRIVESSANDRFISYEQPTDKSIPPNYPRELGPGKRIKNITTRIVDNFDQYQQVQR